MMNNTNRPVCKYSIDDMLCLIDNDQRVTINIGSNSFDRVTGFPMFLHKVLKVDVLSKEVLRVFLTDGNNLCFDVE